MPTAQVPFVDLHGQHEAIREEVFARWSSIVDRSAFTLGDEVREFEVQFARYCSADYSVGLANGTDALILSLRALDVGPGDQVITVANTFVATVEAIVHAGATPVLVDAEPRSFNIDVQGIEQALTPRTKAIIPVHLYGEPAEMNPIMELAAAKGLSVVEDAAQAHGATYQGRPVGSLGHIACFSFYPSKNLGAFGDAGAIVTNNEDLAGRIRELRDHGSSRKYDHRRVGYTSRLHSLQAAVLSTKLPHLTGANEMRQRAARLYQELLAGEPGVILPTVAEGSTHVFHLYVIRVDSTIRDKLQSYLSSIGIETGIHYPKPVHLTESFEYLAYPPETFPVTEHYSEQILSLPMYPGLGPEQVEYVAEEIKNFLRNSTGHSVKVAG